MRFTLPLLVLLTLLLSACTAAPVSPSVQSTKSISSTLSAIVSATLSATEKEVPTSMAAIVPSTTPSQPTIPLTDVLLVDSQPPDQELTRVDEQGAVVVEVTPKNLPNPGDAITFDVALNTHSVDLSMDLAQLATLRTDTGLSASASSWDGLAGGHHVSGNLTFPAKVDGKPFLEGAKIMILVIQNVDAPERTFTWDLEP